MEFLYSCQLFYLRILDMDITFSLVVCLDLHAVEEQYCHMGESGLTSIRGS